MRSLRWIAGVAFLGALAVPELASAAAKAFTTTTVSLRAGPSTNFPRVTRLPAGARITVYGCLERWAWCDASWRGNRGWVSGRNLEYLYRGRRVLIPTYGRQIGLPIISFQFGNYWDDNYSDREWYRERPRWRKNWTSGNWSDRVDEDEYRRRPKDADRYDNDDQNQVRRDGTSDEEQFEEPQRRSKKRVAAEQTEVDVGDRKRLSEEAPRGSAERTGKPCPPGLMKQGRCIDVQVQD